MWTSGIMEWVTTAKRTNKNLVVIDFDAPTCPNGTGMLHVATGNDTYTMRPPCPPLGAVHTYDAFLTNKTLDFKYDQTCVKAPSDAQHIGSLTFTRPRKCQPKTTNSLENFPRSFDAKDMEPQQAYSS